MYYKTKNYLKNTRNHTDTGDTYMCTTMLKRQS